MKVLFINPPRENEIVGNNPALIDEERGFNPPLGILYVAAYLKANTGHEVTVLDCQVEELSYGDIEKRIASSAPDVIGISAMTLCMIDVMKVLETARKVCPEARIVLGGPHVHLYPDESMGLRGVDFLILGEAEMSMAKLVDALETGAPLSDVPSLVYRREGGIIKNPQAQPIADLDSLPHPARELVPYQKYTSILSASHNPVTTMFTSRGCPFLCTFCDRPHLGKRFRSRSAENVVDEFIKCKELGIRFILVYDDTFTVNKKRVLDICKLLIEKKVGLSFDIRARVDTMNTELIAALSEAGCTGIHYGVESGSDRLLKILDKRISLDLVKKTFKETRKAGMKTLAYFMIGCPTETPEEIDMTLRFARELNPDYVHMTILTPFPGTKIYQMALDEGLIKTDVWREFSANPTADFVPPIYGGGLSREEMMDILMRGYKDFYIRPVYVLNKVLEVRSAAQLKKYIKAGLKVLGHK